MMKKKLITHAPKVRAKTRIIAALALPFLITAGCITNEGRNIGEHPSDLGALNSITIGDATEDMALPDIEQNPSISNYVKYALLNNPGIRSAFKEFRAQIQRISQAESLPDPRITYGYFLSSVETRVGPQEHRLSLSQMFPWWGKLELSAEVEKRIAFVKYEEFRAARLDLVNRVKNSYYDLYFTRRKTNIIEENIQLLKGYLSSVLAKYESGSAEYSDVLKVQLEIDNLKDALISNRELISPLVARFNSMLNLEPGAEVALPELIDYGTLSDEKPALLNTVLTENPAILKTEYLTEKDKASLALANKEFYPDITAAIDYTVVGEPRMTGVTDAGKDAVMAGISINIPLWRNRINSKISEQTEKLAADQERLGNITNSLTAELDKAHYDYTDSLRRINLYRHSLLPKAKQQIESAFRLYQAGSQDFLSLIDAQRAYLEFQLNLEEAIVNNAKSIAQLEHITATNL